MFINKPEGSMNRDEGELTRRGLARGLKIFLDVLFYLILLVGVLLVGSLPISAVAGYDDGWDLAVPVVIGESSFVPRLPVEVHLDASSPFERFRIAYGRGQLRLLHHSLPLHLGNVGVSLLFWALGLWGITLLRRILATTARGHPFDPANIRRLNTLGWIIVSASALTSLLQYLAAKWLLSRVEVLTVPASPPIQIQKEWIFCGLLLVVLAAIWKEAARMAEEQALTV
jgi:hypothetical protein